jgi:hypothetical protein
VRGERVAEIDRIAAHLETSLTELIVKADQEIGPAQEDQELGVAGAEGRLAQAENRHAELLARRERRRDELARQRALTLRSGCGRTSTDASRSTPCRHDTGSRPAASGPGDRADRDGDRDQP